MKILKIFGVVVGIHVFALVLIFANPGCSSPNKPAPSPSDTVTNNEDPSPVLSRAETDGVTPVTIASGDSTAMPPSTFDPNASALPAIRFSPTRPGTPAASSLESHPVGDVTPATTYTVGKGDSLWTIARKNHISIAEIAAANNINANTPVRLGQRLIIPSRTPSAHSSTPEVQAAKPAAAGLIPASSRPSGESVKHVVRSGETLGAIARKYQVKVGEIATANNISDPAKIRQGMELVIPGWQAPSGKAAKAVIHSGVSSSSDPATATPESAPAAVPSLVIPAPDGAGLIQPATPSAEPPVIRVDEKQ